MQEGTSADFVIFDSLLTTGDLFIIQSTSSAFAE